MGKQGRSIKPTPATTNKNKHIQRPADPLRPPKGMSPLFKIIPEGKATKDAFAALGYDKEDE